MAKKSIIIDNPFITTGYVSAEYFCDREKETADIIGILRNGNNVALVSPRRYEKTDLLRHCFSLPEIVDNYYTFIIDIYSTKSVSEFVGRLGATILETLKPKGRKSWEKFVSSLASVRHGISFDMNGMPSWTMSVGDIESPSATLDEIFSYLQNADKPCLVAIDEFQQITKYNDDGIEASLRTYIQYCSNAKFVFSGSRQHLMATMFTSPARPFYQCVTLYGLKPLPLDKYTDFCVSHFAKRQKKIDENVVERVYKDFDGITYYMQRVMNELFAHTKTNENCTIADIDTAVSNIIDVSSPIYEDLLYQLPEKQALVLKAIGNEGKATNVTSGKFIKKHGLISANSVKSAVPALIDKGLVTIERGEYCIYDRFFAMWLNKNL
jgi:hypothetical protein